MTLHAPLAPGRLPIGAAIAIVDIGSNSVRLVAYEGLTRSPTPIYNEKVLCGLARGIVTSGRLADDGMERALAAIDRFRMLCDILEVGEVIVVATAAARDASNGPEFLRAATRAIGREVMLLSGAREAELSAMGVVSGIWKPDGVVGDLGGGSLELVDLRGGLVGAGATLPLGGLSLMDASNKSLRQAFKITHRAIRGAAPLQSLKGRDFYAVGGTWRAFAKLHMRQRNYPLQVMHNYTIPAPDAADFAGLIKRVDTDALPAIATVSAQRRPLLAYGAIVLDEIIRKAKPRNIVFSVAGVREGLLYERLSPEDRATDPLIVASEQFNWLRSRSPRHAIELADWAEHFWRSTHLDDWEGEARLRHATCLLADITWRAHPDYRGMQAFDLIVNAAILGIDHPGRAFVALASAIRHVGLNEDVSPQVRGLVSARLQDRARILGAAMRVAYSLSAAMPGVLPFAPMIADRREIVVTLPQKFSGLSSERLSNRLRQLARLIGREPKVVVAT